jgi:predicted unusual protein kinase regulating ubiquinone biosynthesis (AarF/ABC1/UbiB family)
MIVAAYQHAGALLDGADLRMLEETHEALFERFWGIRVGQLRDVALSEARFFLDEYRDVILEAPFQFQADMLFVVRAVGMLAGLATRLDPDFDPWAGTIPFAERFARQELGGRSDRFLKQLETLARLLGSLPDRLDRMLAAADRGGLPVQATLDPSARRLLRRLERAIARLSWTVLGCTLLLAAVICYTSGQSGWLVTALLVLAALPLAAATR